jgi:hypothetical protein
MRHSDGGNTFVKCVGVTLGFPETQRIEGEQRNVGREDLPNPHFRRGEYYCT